MTLTIGELCAGYGGLSTAIEEVFDARPAWFSEFDPAPSKILAHHWPHVPNHGDMTRIDWAAVEPVDIISGGTPCQDLSHAGKRAGMTEGTRSNLWVQMREAIATIRPRYVVWENVRGAYSAAADSEVEPCPGCVGDGSGVNLRALGRVLGDLSDLGYDTAWYGLTAASVGAPHGRFRVFVLAWATADAECVGHEQTLRAASTQAKGQGPFDADSGRDRVRSLADATGDGWDEGWAESEGLIGGSDAAVRSDVAADTNGLGRERDRVARNGRDGSADDCRSSADTHGSGSQGPQPTPRRDVSDWGVASDALSGGCDGRALDEIRCEVGRVAAAGSGQDSAADTNGHALRLEPVTITRGSGAAESGHAVQWGQYEPAIRRWELVLGRPAPSPTEAGSKGAQRLSPRFVEWMQGCPAGHVTGVPGLSRNDQLKALGNGVVPQQAAAALRYLLAATEGARAA